jgi:predicted N-acetyltransferase YhbS
MTAMIRHPRIEEFDTLMRALERCYGAWPGIFDRGYPHLYRPTAKALAAAYVIEEQGTIVSHVGLYPIEVVVHGHPVRIGGIGGVGTLPPARGKGYMTKLLYHVIDEMRAQGYALSWLGGDRQRYNAFGWERGGLAYDLTFSRRALDRAGVESVPIEAQYPADALDVVERLQSLPACHARRSDLALQLRKEGLRVWVSEDGYAIVRGRLFGSLFISELVSASGRETGMIRALLDWTDKGEISWELPACDAKRLARVMPCVSHWRVGGGVMYRIVDLTRLLRGMAPIVARQAAPLRDFSLSIGIREHDRTDVATITVHDGDVQVFPGRDAEHYVEWTAVDAVRVLLGGPPVAPDIPPDLAALLPLPVYVPQLDHV